MTKDNEFGSRKRPKNLETARQQILRERAAKKAKRNMRLLRKSKASGNAADNVAPFPRAPSRPPVARKSAWLRAKQAVARLFNRIG